VTAHGLIDTTEMYLRTVYELTEEGVVPLRARIAERLSQSGPTVSETVARMERDGLLMIDQDRRLALTSEGETLATRVMRKHRLAECLLVDVIGLPWEEVHIEACRWEHVISDSVERRLAALLNYPVRCPHGNVIPGLAELGVPETALDGAEAAAQEPDVAMTAITASVPAQVVVQRTVNNSKVMLRSCLNSRTSGYSPAARLLLWSAATMCGLQVAAESTAMTRRCRGTWLRTCLSQNPRIDMNAW